MSGRSQLQLAFGEAENHFNVSRLGSKIFIQHKIYTNSSK
uniref:Uncharacterized protein n=1 Tax=Anguilla anguilla TaxID=7936 RepID=A0A0E9VPM9_ANGAN